MRDTTKSCKAFSASFTFGDNRQRHYAPKPKSPCRRVLAVACALLAPLSCLLSRRHPPERRFPKFTFHCNRDIYKVQNYKEHPRYSHQQSHNLNFQYVSLETCLPSPILATRPYMQSLLLNVPAMFLLHPHDVDHLQIHRDPLRFVKKVLAII